MWALLPSAVQLGQSFTEEDCRRGPGPLTPQKGLEGRDRRRKMALVLDTGLCDIVFNILTIE